MISDIRWWTYKRLSDFGWWVCPEPHKTNLQGVWRDKWDGKEAVERLATPTTEAGWEMRALETELSECIKRRFTGTASRKTDIALAVGATSVVLARLITAAGEDEKRRAVLRHMAHQMLDVVT